MDKLQLMHVAAGKSAKELEFLIESLCAKQRSLLISLLKEEKDTIEPFVTNNLWASDRMQVICSILASLNALED